MKNNVEESYMEYEEEQNADLGFVVKDLSTAEWAVKKVVKATREFEEVKNFVDEEKRKLDLYLREEKAKYENRVEHLHNLLAEYAREELKDKKEKSIKVMSGSFGFRKQAPTFDRNEEKLLGWAKENKKEFVETKESVNWTELKKTLSYSGEHAVTEDGEVVSGVKVTLNEDKFYVKK